ncbi:MAG: DUF4178 domain-containing protein [Betaproteobacteria bacterium]|nr:DUF4178 domain-containing protein [Betaproteobacteria bacterium]
MYRVPCPGCGAEVVFRSAASVMAVCQYCRSTVLREAGTVKDIGKMSEVLEDYSPLQINSSGLWQGKAFTVVGRIQLRFDAGFWNEWSLLWDDGQGGWLADFSGQYVMAAPGVAAVDAPAFESLAPGAPYLFDGADFRVADVRTAQCTGGQGELPFRVGQGWEAKVADLRHGARFLTLDYSDGTPPQRYLGQAVALPELRMQLLRSDDDIARSAGHLRGTASTLECPSCGGPLSYQAGAAVNVVCPACHAEVDCAGDQAVVLAKHTELAALPTTLAPGDSADIDGAKWSVIGLLRARETGSDETSEWTEYLLHNPGRGFFWLVESDQGWERVRVLDEWPQPGSGEQAVLHGEAFEKQWDYGSEVIYAAGAFNWRVAVGERTAITSYARAERTLTAERNARELVWSLATPVAPQEIARWFGRSGAAAKALAPSKAAAAEFAPLRRIAKVYTWMLMIFNLPTVFGSGWAGLLIIALALAFLWVPVLRAAAGDAE